MNSTELYIAAGDAINEWTKTHNTACVLSINTGKIICGKAPESSRLRNNPLYVSKFEMDRGMQQNRWNVIGTALHNLYCKELACQARQKH